MVRKESIWGVVAMLALSGTTFALGQSSDKLSDQVLTAAQKVDDPVLMTRVQGLYKKLYPAKGEGKLVLTATGAATVLPSGQILLPKAEVLDCGSDDELAGLIAVQQALIDLDSWGRLEKAAAAGLQTADERAVKIRLSLSGEPAYLINPDWPDAYEKEAVERAGADLIKAGFDPAAIVTEAEHRALLASDPDTVASFGIGDPIAVRRQFVTSSGRTLRRSAVSPFFAIRAGTSPAMGFAELMGKPVFKESADHFASVDWQSLAGLLDSETTLFRLRVDGQKIVERKTAMFEVTGADPATVLAELKHALSDAKFRLWRLQKGGQSV